jgi:HK97 gp10 family phage protein
VTRSGSTLKRPKSGDAVVVVGLKIAVGKGGGKADLNRAGARGGKARKDAARKSAHWRWHFIEFGTSKMAAKPFLRPAFFSNKSAMLETLKSELAVEIEKAWKTKARATGRSAA